MNFTELTLYKCYLLLVVVVVVVVVVVFINMWQVRIN